MTRQTVYELWGWLYCLSYIAMPALCILALAEVLRPSFLIAAVLIHFAADVATQTMKGRWS